MTLPVVEKIRRVPQKLAHRLQGYLNQKSSILGYKVGGVIYSWGFNFDKGFKITVKIVNTTSGPNLVSYNTWNVPIKGKPTCVDQKRQWGDLRWLLEGISIYKHPFKEVICHAKLELESNTREFMMEEQ